jgi:DnaA family protein
VIDQLLLPFSLNPEATFATWVVADNDLLVERLQQVLSVEVFACVYWWSDQPVGKTHLLQACCHQQQINQRPHLYLPLRQANQFSPEILQGCEQLSLICLDDIDAVIDSPEWSEALFHAYNRCQANHVPWLVSAAQPAKELDWCLADLHTRVMAGEIYRLRPLSDEQKCVALQQHSQALGLSLADDVAQYWLHHGARDMPQLMRELAVLDRAAWQRQRRLTIPFLKTIFAWS